MRKKLQVALQTAQKAGILEKEMQLTASVGEKGKNNLVTSADLAAENLIVSEIKREFPDHAFLAEENFCKSGVDFEHLWIIDPLDGTNNYAQGIPHYCVSIAYAYKGEVLVGVVYDPMRGECFTAEKGKGAFLNDKRIGTSRCSDLDCAMIVTGFYYDRGEIMEKTLNSMHTLFKAGVRGIKVQGSAALDFAWVACGRFDAYFEYKLSPWDFAAGLLIVNEAGGVCRDRYGKLLGIESQSVVVSNGKFHKEFFEIVKWANK